MFFLRELKDKSRRVDLCSLGIGRHEAHTPAAALYYSSSVARFAKLLDKPVMLLRLFYLIETSRLVRVPGGREEKQFYSQA